MTTKDAHKIPLVQLLEKLGFRSINTEQLGNDVWYKSPFRPDERAANFHVDIRRNVWYDFVTNKGGTTLDFVKDFNGCDETTSLAFLQEIFSTPPKIPFKNKPLTNATSNAPFVLKAARPLMHPQLLSYLSEEKKIKQAIAKKYLVEVDFTHTQDKKDYFAAAMGNESNGYEVRNKYFDGFLGQKDISILRGGQPAENTVSVFHNLLDFLSAVEYYGEVLTDNDVIIVHHATFLQKTMRLIAEKPYAHVFTYFETSEIGEEILKTFQAEFGKKHEPCNGFYYPHKDFNSYWQAKKR